MKVRKNEIRGEDKIELQMTPMIDIVFQLLIFFIMTFKIVSLEGDFNVKMPASAPSDGTPDDDELPPMVLKMGADGAGNLTSMSLQGSKIPDNDWDALRGKIKGLLETGGPTLRETAEVELDCAPGLHYEYVIRAITAVSGQKEPDGTVVPLVEKIKFAPPKKRG